MDELAQRTRVMLERIEQVSHDLAVAGLRLEELHRECEHLVELSHRELTGQRVEA